MKDIAAYLGTPETPLIIGVPDLIGAPDLIGVPEIIGVPIDVDGNAVERSYVGYAERSDSKNSTIKWVTVIFRLPEHRDYNVSGNLAEITHV